jgi:hypothetical protein
MCRITGEQIETPIVAEVDRLSQQNGRYWEMIRERLPRQEEGRLRDWRDRTIAPNHREVN